MNKGGRPTKLTPELVEKAEGFLSYMEGQILERVYFTKDGRQEVKVQRPPTQVLFAQYLGIHRETVTEWTKIEEGTDEEKALVKRFSDIAREVQQAYEQTLIDNGVVDKYNAGFAKFLLSADHGKREKSETDLTSRGERIVGFEFVNPPNGHQTTDSPVA